MLKSMLRLSEIIEPDKFISVTGDKFDNMWRVHVRFEDLKYYADKVGTENFILVVNPPSKEEGAYGTVALKLKGIDAKVYALVRASKWESVRLDHELL